MILTKFPGCPFPFRQKQRIVDELRGDGKICFPVREQNEFERRMYDG